MKRMKRCSSSVITDELSTEKQEDLAIGERPAELKSQSQSQSQSVVSKKQRRTRRYHFMTNDELVNLCQPKQRPQARRVVHHLRNYLIQISEKEGFDIDFFPGVFYGVTTVAPLEYSSYHPPLDGDPKWIAQSVINQYYNLVNEETKYEVEYVEKMYASGAFTFYLTFCARDVKNQMAADAVAPPSLRTFQASVMMVERSIHHIFLCRLKA